VRSTPHNEQMDWLRVAWHTYHLSGLIPRSRPDTASASACACCLRRHASMRRAIP